MKRETLPSSSPYVRTRISSTVCEHLRQNGIHADLSRFNWNWTVDDLVYACKLQNPDLPHDHILRVVNAARALAFDAKYSSYTYNDDSRGLYPNWHSEFMAVMRQAGAEDYKTRKLIVVGIGNGVEGESLFNSIENLTIVDIAPESLRRAHTRLPSARAILSAAEQLDGVDDHCSDVYISLRVYQSALFDTNAALAQAWRVLISGGIIVISVSNGFVGEGSKLVHGHILPGSSEVDDKRPYILAETLMHKMRRLGFRGIQIFRGFAELYILGNRP